MVSSTRDCVTLECKHATPTVALATDAFIPQAKFQATELGMQNAAIMFVSHPLSDTSKQIMEQKADAIYDGIVQGLTSPVDQIPRDPRWCEQQSITKTDFEETCLE